MTISDIFRIVFICIEVLLLFNLLIFVHELGHFLAAKWRGLHVVEFALWFGKPLWRKKIGGVWYAINSIPAGGYVKLPQMAPMEAIEGETEELPPEAKVAVKPLDKIIVAFAGPLFSFLLACFFAVIVWQVGRPVRESESTTQIGYVLRGSPAEKAGLRPGDMLKAIDGHPIRRWQGMSNDSVMWRVVTSEGTTIHIDYERDGKAASVEARPEVPPTKIYQRRAMRQIGIEAAESLIVEEVKAGDASAEAGLRASDLILAANGQPIYVFDTLADVARANPNAPLLLTVERDGKRIQLTRPLVLRPPAIEQVFPDGPAARAGVQMGDRVVRVNGEPVFAPVHVSELVERAAANPIKLEVDRAGAALSITVTPEVPVDDTKPRIGIQWSPEDTLGLTLRARSTLVHPSPLEQVRLSALSIVSTISAIASRKSDVSAQHLGGPVTIFRTYYILFKSPDGWRMALWFSVLLNVNLALLNLLPLPVLDGGHITLAIFEIIRRRPVQGGIEMRILETVQTLSAVVLIGFMVFITFFDVQDLFGSRSRPTMKFAPKSQAK